MVETSEFQNSTLFPCTTWPAVWDDAVKIGLGALIGAVSVYFTARQGLKLQLRGEYSKRRRDGLEKIAPEFDEMALRVYERAVAISVLPFGQGKEIFDRMINVLRTQHEFESDLPLKLHALEARLALLAFPDIADAVERYRTLATMTIIGTPGENDDPTEWGQLADNILKQMTLVTTMMAVAYRDA